MKLKRTENAIKGSIWGILQRLIGTILPFVVRTAIIHKLGSEYVGINGLFSSILQVLNLSELGLNSAIVYNMYEPIAKEDTAAICALLNFYKKVYRIIGLVVLVIGLAILPILPSLIHGNYPPDINIYWIYFVFLGNTVLSYFMFSYKGALLSAYQRVDVLSITSIITSSVMYVLQFVMVFFFRSFYLYIILLPLFTIIGNLLNQYISLKMYPDIKCFGKLSKVQINNIKTRVYGAAIGKVSIVARGSFSSIILSSIFGLVTLSIYDSYIYITAAVTSMLGIIEGALVAGVGNSVVLCDKNKNHEDMMKFTFLYQFLVTVCTAMLICLYQPFMRIWVGESLMLTDIEMFAFVAYFYISSMCSIHNVYANALGLWWDLRLKSILETVLNFVLIALGGYFFGIVGVLISMSLVLFFVTYLLNMWVIYKKYYGVIQIKRNLMLQLKLSCVTIVSCIISYSLCMLIPLSGVLGILVKAIVSVLASFAVFLVLNCKSKYVRSIYDYLCITKNLLLGAKR